MTDRRYNGIDIIKFICSYLVCIIHIIPIQGVDFKYAGYINYFLQNGICRIAVPFFFCSSGFLLFRKIDQIEAGGERVKNYCFKTLQLLGVWTILLFMGSTVHLWYLGGLVIASFLITSLLMKKFSRFSIAIVVACLYIMGLLGDSYSGFVERISNHLGVNAIYKVVEFFSNDITHLFRLGLFFAPLFFFMGVLFAHIDIKLKSFVAILGFLLSVVLLLFESAVVKHFSKPLDHNLYISLIPLTFFLFYIAITLRLPNKPIYRKLRAIGVLIFFLHLFVKKVLELLFLLIQNISGFDLSFLLLLFTLIFTTLLAVGIEKVTRKEKYKKFRILFNG